MRQNAQGNRWYGVGTERQGSKNPWSRGYREFVVALLGTKVTSESFYSALGACELFGGFAAMRSFPDFFDDLGREGI